MNISQEVYNKKIESIFERFPSVQKESFNKAYKPGLENMQRFSEALGSPINAFRTIHVAGTNGKGSVADMLAAALSASGLKTGLYTSPHIVDFRERLKIDGKMVSKEYVYDFLCENDALMEDLNLSFFEITTGMAFKWFADEKVDVAVIEVGLGGRLDSTNIITPDLSIVTSIALDHCALLGNTLEAIAGEKAGIFKKGVPALVGEALPETRPVFEAKAEGLCPLHFAEEEEPSMWQMHEEILANMDLRGACQRKNLRTVLAAVDLLKERSEYSSLKEEAVVAEAIEHTASLMDFHGRWEVLRRSPLVIADMGHNPAALKGNFAQLEAMRENGEYSSLIIIYAVMADKDLDGILPLMPRNAEYFLTSPAIPRALPTPELTARFNEYFSKHSDGVCPIINSTLSVKDALEKALHLAENVAGANDLTPPDSVHSAPSAGSAHCAPSAGAKPLVFVCGSAYLVSEAIPMM